MKTIPILASLLILGACASDVLLPVRTVTDVDADAGVIDLASGQDLEVALPMTAGTGYSWRPDYETPALLVGGSSFVTEAKAPGAPIRMVYRYTAAGYGRTHLAYTLTRPWENDHPNDRRVVFRIRVR
jgi:predicted secreted protein